MDTFFTIIATLSKTNLKKNFQNNNTFFLNHYLRKIVKPTSWQLSHKLLFRILDKVIQNKGLGVIYIRWFGLFNKSSLNVRHKVS